MKKILLINFKRIGDIISSLSAVTIQENVEYHMLCFKEFKKVPRSLNNRIHFHFIDRRKIEFLIKSPLINDAFAINELQNSIKDLYDISFDEIINFSNDKLASRLVSLFKNGGTITRGIYFENNQIFHPGIWEIYYNNVIPGSSTYPINLKDIFGYMIGNPNQRSSDFLKFNDKNEEMVTTNFEAIRAKLAGYGVNPKIVGIAPFASSTSKSISVEETIELIKKFKDEQRNQVTVLIHAPIPTEKEKVDLIAEAFAGQLITIEADLLALNSVLRHLDCLITPDSATIHYANAIGVKSLMVAKGEAPLFLQGTAEPGDLILTNISTSGGKVEDIDVLEIFKASQLLLDPEKEFDLSKFKSRLYLVNADAFGTYYLQVTNHVDYNLSEVKRDILRNFIIKAFVGFRTKVNVPSKIMHADATKALFESEKLKVLSITKSVLTCLRLLKTSSPDGQKQFVQTLDSIITYMEDSNSLTSLPVNLFYHQINQIQATSKEDNLKQFEKKLFELKNNTQILFNLFKDYETALINQKAKISQKVIRETEMRK